MFITTNIWTSNISHAKTPKIVSIRKIKKKIPTITECVAATLTEHDKFSEFMKEFSFTGKVSMDKKTKTTSLNPGSQITHKKLGKMIVAEKHEKIIPSEHDIVFARTHNIQNQEDFIYVKDLFATLQPIGSVKIENIEIFNNKNPKKLQNKDIDLRYARLNNVLISTGQQGDDPFWGLLSEEIHITRAQATMRNPTFYFNKKPQVTLPMNVYIPVDTQSGILHHIIHHDQFGILIPSLEKMSDMQLFALPGYFFKKWPFEADDDIKSEFGFMAAPMWKTSMFLAPKQWNLFSILFLNGHYRLQDKKNKLDIILNTDIHLLHNIKDFISFPEYTKDKSCTNNINSIMNYDASVQMDTWTFKNSVSGVSHPALFSAMTPYRQHNPYNNIFGYRAQISNHKEQAYHFTGWFEDLLIPFHKKNPLNEVLYTPSTISPFNISNLHHANFQNKKYMGISWQQEFNDNAQLTFEIHKQDYITEKWNDLLGIIEYSGQTRSIDTDYSYTDYGVGLFMHQAHDINTHGYINLNNNRTTYNIINGIDADYGFKFLGVAPLSQEIDIRKAKHAPLLMEFSGSDMMGNMGEIWTKKKSHKNVNATKLFTEINLKFLHTLTANTDLSLGITDRVRASQQKTPFKNKLTIFSNLDYYHHKQLFSGYTSAIVDQNNKNSLSFYAWFLYQYKNGQLKMLYQDKREQECYLSVEYILPLHEWMQNTLSYTPINQHSFLNLGLKKNIFDDASLEAYARYSYYQHSIGFNAEILIDAARHQHIQFNLTLELFPSNIIEEKNYEKNINSREFYPKRCL